MSSMSPDLTVTADANVAPFEKGIERAQSATQRWETSLSQLEADMMALEKSMDDHATAAIARQHDAMDKTGKAMFTFGLIGAAAFALSANEAIKWEAAWAGVSKTVDGNAEQMGVLEEQLRGLTAVLPASHEEIAAVAEAAGQLGVAREDIASFTETAINLGETTDLAAEEAATSLAQLMNIMQSAPETISQLGSTIVELGNNGASTESQITAMALRVAGAGQMVGATEADVLALSSAMANLGIQAELGGGAIQRSFITINSAVSEGGDKMAGFARMADMSGQEFAAAWREDPIAAFDALIGGMGRVQAGGGDLAAELGKLGIEGTQNLQVMLRLAGAGDTLTEALSQARGEWQDNNALVEEAAKRYETTEAKIQMARNQLREASIDIGSALLPAILALVETGTNLLRFWQDLPGPIKGTITVLALATTGVALFGGAALIAIPKIAAFKAAVAGLEAGALKTAGTRLMGLGSILGGPWGIALAAGVTALGFFAAKQGDAAREVDALKATLDEQTGALSENSRQWAIKKLSEEGVLDTAKDLGLDLAAVTDAALGNEEALAGVNAELDKFRYGSLPEGMDYETWNRFGLAAEDVSDALSDTNGTVAESRRQFELESEALGGAERAAGGAAEGQDALTGSLEDGAGAAAELTEEVKTLGEELSELSGDYLNNREAGRAVRDSLREIRKATRDYVEEHGNLKGAFKKGTASGDEFAGMLDGLAQDYLRQIETTERLTGSEQAVRREYRQSRAALMEVAQQLGMTRDQARRYVDTVLGVPGDVNTHFTTPGLTEAISQAASYRGSLNNIPSSIKTTIFQEMQVVSTPRKKENGGIVTAYDSGGFSFGRGTAVARESRIARGGENILWAEPSTGWEAYISGKPGQESRNRDIWAEAGRRLGVTASGGTHTIERIIERPAGGTMQLIGPVTLSVGGKQIRGMMRGEAVAVADQRDAATGQRDRMDGWGR